MLNRVTPIAPMPAEVFAPGAERFSLKSGLQKLEALFDSAFGAAINPWRHLGALSFYFFWAVAVSGIYVYVVFDTSVEGAYASVQYLTLEQWYLGGVMRSVHRYASDAMALTVLLHLLKEWVSGRYARFRWFSWITGVPLLWLLVAAGMGGYWLVWDQLAQFSLIAISEWLDWLPFFAEPLVRNFLGAASISDRFFSLLIFLHIGIPLALLLGMWVHIQRIVHADTQPPRVLAGGSLAMLLLLSFAKPAVSHAPADLSLVPGEMHLDWFYLFIHPLLYEFSAATAWMLVFAATLLLLSLPWLVRAPKQPAARVDLANCNGCGRCFADCPYAAVVMLPRSDNRPGVRMASVDPDLCASCGICAGACPSSTPFRSVEELVTGIDMPQLPIRAMRSALEKAVAALRGETKIIVFGCDCGAQVTQLARADTAAVSLLCAGQLPPSFVEYALRAGADGVLVTGCRSGDCSYRLGNVWTEQRLRGEREPHLRAAIPFERVKIAWAGPLDQERLAGQVTGFRATLAALPSHAFAASPPKRKEHSHA